jgi:hypothetical protein
MTGVVMELGSIFKNIIRLLLFHIYQSISGDSVSSNNSSLCSFSHTRKPPLFLAIIFYFASSSALSSNFSISHSQFEQYITLDNQEVFFKPSGQGVFLSLDLHENWNARFDYQKWQDDLQGNNPMSLDLAYSSYGGSISFTQANWYVTTNFDFIEDDISYISDPRGNDHHNDLTTVSSFSGQIGYSWVDENWLFDVSVGAQYSDWLVENKTYIRNQVNASDENVSTEDSTSTFNMGFSAARYWELTKQQGILVGALFSWSYQFSGDEGLTGQNISPEPPKRPQRIPNGGNSISRITSGDDNYGQLMFYASYDINEAWSLDFDTSVDIATTNNSQGWAIGISYNF